MFKGQSLTLKFFNRSQSLRVGPKLPKHLNFPCLAESNEYGLYFIMGSALYDKEIHTYLYFPSNDSWKDITGNNSCKSMSQEYSCSIIHSHIVVISVLTHNHNVCSEYYNLHSMEWVMNGIIDVGKSMVSKVTMLKSENKEFATLLASSVKSNLTFIFQVRMFLMHDNS